MIFLLFNAGAMLGHFHSGLKNVWPMLIVLFFINSPLLARLGLAALGLILANIVLQFLAITLILCFRRIGPEFETFYLAHAYIYRA